MKEEERDIPVLAWLFLAPLLVGFVGLGLAFVGLIARHYESSAYWGIWFSIIGWSTFGLSFPLRWWAKRWSRRMRQ
jgi:hypothetical protein